MHKQNNESCSKPQESKKKVKFIEIEKTKELTQEPST